MGAASRRRIPEATVARLPLYYRALLEAGERQVADDLVGTPRRAGRRERGQGPQGPLVPRLLRHPRRRLRRRVPAPRDLPRAGPHPRLAGRHRRHRQPGSCARELPGLRRPRVPRRGARRRRPEPRRQPRSATSRSSRSTTSTASSPSARSRSASSPCPRAAAQDVVRPARRGGRDVDPQLRARGRAPSPKACRCARSTSRSSCRSCPSTNSGAAARRPLRTASEPGA